MTREDTLHLIVIDDSSNDAEAVSNTLRNAGHAVRAVRVEDDEALREALKTQSCDMLLSKLEIPFFNALDVLAVVEQRGKDFPVILLADPQKQVTAVIDALKAGARDAVSLDEPERLEHVILRELTDLRARRLLQKCEKTLLESNQRAQSLVESSRDAIAYVHDGMHIFANDSYLEMFGYTDPGEIEGMPLLNMVAPEYHDRLKTFLRDYGKGSAGADRLEVHGVRADTNRFDITMEFSRASYEGEDCTQIIIRNQLVNKELEEKLEEVSKTDLLTGAFNRQFFLKNFQKAVASKRFGALFFINPDNFAELRKELGLTGTDSVLADLATFLKTQLPEKNSLLSRFEDHTFAALVMNLDEKLARTLGNKIQRAVEEHIADVDGSTATLTCSIGISLFSDGTGNPHDLLSRAEKALQSATELGGNRAHVHSPAAEELAESERHALFTKQLKLALRDNRFFLVYQPIASLQGDESENYEVFVRMRDPEGNEVYPADFLPAAEKTGLMAALDRWIIHHAVRALSAQRKAGKAINLFVKLSSASLRDPKLLPWLRDLLKAARLEGSHLTIEVTETVAQSNLKAIKILTEGLRQLRVRLAIDHFGIAANSGNLLKHCAADFIKIDGSLITGLASDPKKLDRIRELNDLSKRSGRLTIGESVEDAGTLATLWSCGFDYIQGNFLQEPAPHLDFDFSSVG